MSQSSQSFTSPASDNSPTCSTSVPSAILAARQAFLGDLDELLQSNEGDWAAYTKDGRIACGPSKRVLYRKCLDLGLSEGEFLVASIEPDVPSEE